MSNLDKREQTDKPNEARPSLGKGLPAEIDAEFNEVKNQIDSARGKSITKAIKRLNGLKRGCYWITCKNRGELQEIELRLHESSIKHRAIASGFIDYDRTREGKTAAVNELCNTAMIYLRLEM